MQAPHIFPPVYVQIDLEPILPFRNALEGFAAAARVAEGVVKAAAKFVRGDGRIVVGTWGTGVVFVYQINGEGVTYFGELVDIEASESHEVAVGELQGGEPEAKEAPEAAVFLSEIFEENFIVLAFGGENLGMEDLAFLVDAEKDEQIFRIGVVVGILNMAGLCGGTYARGVSA